MWICDSHLDLGMNALYYSRDLRLSLNDLRAGEGGAHPDVGTATVTLAEMLDKRLPLAFGTFIALPRETATQAFDFGYTTQAEAEQHALKQLEYYRGLVDEGQLRVITDLSEFEQHVAECEAGTVQQVGIILQMEGADPILSPDDVPRWYADGLRMIGPAWYGEGRYVFGTSTPGGFKKGGPELLKAMQDVGMILDMAHLAEEAFYQALDLFDGPVLASHANSRALVPGDRQLSDDMIRKLVEGDGVIGAVCDCWMLEPNWREHRDNSRVTLATVADHIDHVCQIAGNANHAGFGSDLDGGFGREQSPGDLNSIGDLHRVAEILGQRGYKEEDLENICHGNWLRLIRKAWG
jgi:membrane dipeptidase